MRLAAAAVLVAAGCALFSRRPPVANTAEAAIRRALLAGKGTIDLPHGVIEVHREIEIPAEADHLEIRGSPQGTTLRACDDFQGQAVFRCERATRVRFADFAVDGNRTALERRTGLPGFSTPFVRFTAGNGILAVDARSLQISNIRFSNVPGFAILVSRSQDVSIDGVSIVDSGSRTAAGRNNTSGGILLEEGTHNFAVTRCDVRNVRGNGIWTHSLGMAPQNHDARIASNHFERVGRDAIQVGHGLRIRVEDNSGSEIGYPLEDVDMEDLATPVAIDTAGDTADSQYLRNHFAEINGKCIDLDGFHDGSVIGNSCVNHFGTERYPYANLGIVFNNSTPSMRSENVDIEDNELDGAVFSGIFVIGERHRIAHNRLLHLNRAHCGGSTAQVGCSYSPGEPGLLRSGIYLANGGQRTSPAQANVIEDNQISGFGMSANCINVASGVPISANTIARNICRDDPAK